MMRAPLCCTIALIAISLSKAEATTTLSPIDEFMIAADGVVVPIGGSEATAGNSGNPSNGAAWQYAARERGVVTQTDRRVATFLKFDTSALTTAEVNASDFAAVFSVTHFGHLNNVNPGMDLGIGQIVSGDWDDDGGATPVFSWALDSSTNQSSILQNVQNFPGLESLTFDATAIVQDWVINDTNQGFALFGYEDGGGGNPTNGSYFGDASLVVGAIPEPSTSMLALLGTSALLFRRRRD